MARGTILPIQIVKIKMAQKQLGINEAAYRDSLADIGAKSCTELSREQADLFLANLRHSGWHEKQKNKKYSEFDKRAGRFATGAQMRMIEAMWMQKAREKTQPAMNKFILRITKKSHITMLLKTDIKNLKKAIENLK